MITKKQSSWLALGTLGAICLLGTQIANATHTNVYNEAGSLIDTTDYSALAQGVNDGFWFANFANASAVTGAAMNSSEASSIPPVFLLDTDPANVATTFSFQDGPPISTSTGGQPNFNIFTLPNGAVGISGESVDNPNPSNNTDNYVSFAVGAFPVTSASIYVVVDNAVDANNDGFVDNINDAANPNARLRFRIREADDTGDLQVEAFQGLNNVGASNNGIADAYRFDFTNLTPGDIIKIRVTSANNSHGGISGIIFDSVVQIPEPTSAALLVIGSIGLISRRRRR